MKKGEGRVVKYPANGCQVSCVPIPISPLNLSWAAVAAIHPQIATDRGPRDLRMRCVGGVAAVTAIMGDLTLTVQVRGEGLARGRLL